MSEKTIKFSNPEEKKHSVRYYEVGEERVLGSVYVSKKIFEEKWPEELSVTVEW